MKMRLEDKRTAIDLRVRGKSYREIRSIIPNLSKSTLSNWLKNVILTEEQEKRLKNNIDSIVFNARARSAWTNSQKNIERTKVIFEEAKKDISGDDDEAKDTGEANLDPVAQDRDIADEKVEEQQEEDTEKEVEIDTKEGEAKAE